ncbi:hypothetical protein D3C76_1431950 [compost metagenome]
MEFQSLQQLHFQIHRLRLLQSRQGVHGTLEEYWKVLSPRHRSHQTRYKTAINFLGLIIIHLKKHPDHLQDESGLLTVDAVHPLNQMERVYHGLGIALHQDLT